MDNTHKECKCLLSNIKYYVVINCEVIVILLFQLTSEW